MNIPFLSKTKTKTKTKTSPGYCCHQTKEGAPCNATPQAGKAYCFFHDPELAQERAAARRQGGLTSIGKAAPVVPPNLPLVSLKTLDDVAQLVEQIVNYVLQGQMDLRTANNLCSLVNGQIRTLQANARAEREAAKATLAGKASRESAGRKQHHPATELRMTNMLTGEPQVIGNSQSTFIHPSPPIAQDQTLPGKGVPPLQPNMCEPGVPAVSLLSSPGVFNSRESACGNSYTTNSFSPPPKSNEVPNEFAANEIKAGTQNEALPDSTPRAGFEAVKSFAGQRQQKRSAQNGFDPEHVETTPTPRPNPDPANARPDVAFIGIPGLLPRHLNYQKFAGMPVPNSQRKRVRIPLEFASSVCAKSVEFDINNARARRDRQR